MGRFSVTTVFEVPPGKSPRGPDVLERMVLPDRAVHRFSYCDGRSLTAVVDWRAARAEQACADAVLGIRLVWAQITGQDPGPPLSVRVRVLDLRARVSAGARAREFRWVPDVGGQGRLVPLDTRDTWGPDDAGRRLPATTAGSPASGSPGARSPHPGRQPSRWRSPGSCSEAARSGDVATGAPAGRAPSSSVRFTGRR